MARIVGTQDVGRNIDSWMRHLAVANLAPRTLEIYRMHAGRMARWLEERGITDSRAVEREHVQAYIQHLLDTTSPANAAMHYRSIQQFWRWCYEEEVVPVSPMSRMRPPKVPEPVTPVVGAADLKKLMKACAGRGFEERRDTAIISLLWDTGMRRGELAGMRYSADPVRHDVDLQQRLVRVMGKGRRERLVPIGAQVTRALDRYEMARASHLRADDEAYWLGRRGGITGSGVRQIILRRCREAGIPEVHPHQFRHSFAANWITAGGDETSLMRIAGWRSRSMLSRYGNAAADQQARAAHARVSPLDNM